MDIHLASNRDSFLEKLKRINDYIINKLGGTLLYTEDKKNNLFKIKWQKYSEEINKTIQFEMAFSFEELESIMDPIIIGKSFVRKYEKKRKDNEHYELRKGKKICP